MSKNYLNPWYYRLSRKIGSQRPASWLFARTFHHLDPRVYQASRGRYTLTGLLTGLPVITLITTGAKSGKKRNVPLIGIPDGDNYIVIASNWGQKHFPAWYQNLTANPRVAITTDHQSGCYIARETTGEEYDTYWKTAVGMYAGYAAYKRRTGGRRIPIVMLTPDGR